MAEEKRALRLNAGQFTRLIKITRATSRYAERDVLVLMLGHHCGLRVTEISRITVADVLQASGKLRQEVSLREAVTKGCRQRCTYLSSRGLIDAMEGYLAYRQAHGIGTELDAARYRGLLPHQPLIYSGRGAALSQNTKRRTLETGEQRDYKAVRQPAKPCHNALQAGWHQRIQSQWSAGFCWQRACRDWRHGHGGHLARSQLNRLLATLRGRRPGHAGSHVC